MNISAGDTAWMLASSALVFFMCPGLAFFYGGLVRKKNALNTLLMACASMATGALAWMTIGYSLAFAPGNPILGGLSWVMYCDLPSPCAYAPTIPPLLFAGFQGMFAAIAPALISGAIVERMNFRAYVIFLALWTVLVYAPIAHWVWSSQGWIHQLGALDFAGGTVVHIAAGTAALVCAFVLGPRQDSDTTPLVPHNIPFVVLGAGMLWFGWFGFNAGSALGANEVAALALVTTNLSAAGAMMTWLWLEKARTDKSTAVGASTGAVVGLVAITPAAGFVTPMAALAIGVIAALVCYHASHIRNWTKVDDTLDVFSCHGVAGVVGALLTGVFATTAVNAAGGNGWLAQGDAKLLFVQVIAIAATMIYTAIITGVLLKLVQVMIPLRVGLRQELEGLDRHSHGEQAYHDSSPLGAITLFPDTEDTRTGSIKNA